MDLKEYERTKFELAAILRSAWLGLDASNPAILRVSHDFFARLAEDRFNLVVVGRFNRGKTSLMNALLRARCLPVGVVPLTSVITTVSYGSQERAVIEYQNRRTVDRIPLDRLAEFVSERGNPANALGVTTARVQLPSELLRRGFYFIDTPGLGSSIVENTRTTEAFLPEADAIVLVTSYDSPLTEEEVRALESAAGSSRRAFIAVNKHDVVSPPERAEVLRYMQERLLAIFGPRAPYLFSVSAHQALTAHETADEHLWIQSGLPELERDLSRFLVEEKREEFLRQMYRRAAQALDEIVPAREERERLHLLYDRLWGNRALEPSDGVQLRTASARFDSCAICARIENALYTFLCRYQYDLIAGEDARTNLCEHGGLCALHTWHYERIASPRGTCIAFPALLRRVASSLLDAGSDPPRDEVERRPSEPTCDVCAISREAETTEVRAVARRLGEESGIEARDVPSLCMRHLRCVAEHLDDRERRAHLLRAQAQVLDEIADDMQRYVVKFDGVRKTLLTSEEETAAQRALKILAGSRNISALPKE